MAEMAQTDTPPSYILTESVRVPLVPCTITDYGHLQLGFFRKAGIRLWSVWNKGF